MRAYTKALFQGPVSTRQAAVGPPSGYLWVVRDVSAVSFAGTAQSLWWGVNGIGIIDYFTFEPTLAGKVYHWQGRQAIAAGQQLLLQADAAVAVFVTGYELGV